ncbi:threonine/homoserine/homoserine lactone efflux protein [Christiangramia gaetbulicola]|uniref:Threonine/homoserine/homoserine lactone efflux protein n=1 Tax=Christiangramia gaetbulicola TaxID=703340 RepID=A0A2T6AL42_9FLAO|nr:LysE family transporter [Christiangramia gaetbulicola]PTX44542.1 threonine/homoserine/homoserine lactone efflux protein [Christiangramia gaetbulicola]
MEETKLFLITYFAAFIGVVPPGLVNMTVAKTCVEKGKKSGLFVAIGAGIVILTQAFIAVLLAKYIFDHPFVRRMILRAGLVVFCILGVYFFIKARHKKGVKHNRQKAQAQSLFKGMLIAALNVFPIPYFVAIAGAMDLSGGMDYDWSLIISFATAACLGSFTSLYLYVELFDKIEKKAESFAKYSNYFMAGLMLVLIIVALVRILNT